MCLCQAAIVVAGLWSGGGASPLLHEFSFSVATSFVSCVGKKVSLMRLSQKEVQALSCLNRLYST